MVAERSEHHLQGKQISLVDCRRYAQSVTNELLPHGAKLHSCRITMRAIVEAREWRVQIRGDGPRVKIGIADRTRKSHSTTCARAVEPDGRSAWQTPSIFLRACIYSYMVI